MVIETTAPTKIEPVRRRRSWSQTILEDSHAEGKIQIHAMPEGKHKMIYKHKRQIAPLADLRCEHLTRRTRAGSKNMANHII